MKRILLMLAVALVGIASLAPAAVQACAVCGVGPDFAGDPTARGFYWGVLFLMAMPFAVAGSIGAYLAYRYWRASAERRRRTPARASAPAPDSEGGHAPLIFHPQHWIPR